MTAAITNQYRLPGSYVRAVSSQRTTAPYSISATQLIKPPQMLALELQHRSEIVKDASDFIDTFFGTAVHHFLDHHAGDDAASEERMVWEHEGWTIHGTPDHAEWIGVEDETVLTDWKTTKVRALRYDKPEWEQQVNIYAHLLRLNGIHVASAQVWAFLKDWDRGLLREPEYPRAPLCLVPVPLWDAFAAHEFMLGRLELHKAALLDGAYGPCTPEERWQRPSYAVWSKRQSAQKPSRVLRTQLEADIWIELHTEHPRKAEDWWEVEVRNGEPLRCQSYCDAAAFCGQWRKEQDERLAAQEDPEGAVAFGESRAPVPLRFPVRVQEK